MAPKKELQDDSQSTGTFVSALGSPSATTSASALESASALIALSEIAAAAAWSPESASAPSTTRAPEAASTSSSVPLTLEDDAPIKLEGLCNLVAWKEQVTRVLVEEDLLDFVSNPTAPLKYASQAELACDVVSEEYEEWVNKDKKLRTFLVSSLSEFIANFVREWEHAWEIWSAVHEMCRNELVSKIKIAVKAEIKNTKKENQTVKDYVDRITGLIGALLALGDDVTEKEHVQYILDGLPEDYESLRTIVRARGEQATVFYVVEQLMLVEETLVNNQLAVNSLLSLGSLNLGNEGNDDVDDGAGRGSGRGSGGH